MAGMTMNSLLKNRLESFRCCANDVIHFKLVRQKSDLEDDSTTFHPEMTHQLFGEQESIFGYKDLIVEMFYSASRLTTYVNMQYFEKISPNLFDGIEPDNVMETVAKEIPPGFVTNKDEFTRLLPKDASFKPYGEMLHSYKVSKGNDLRNFEIYHTDIETPGFREYHERLQTFILFFIDGASVIDVDDSRWHFYLLFEKYKVNENPMHAIAGYMTVYNYYAYPEKKRPRVSQVLILPPFQKQGHGAELLQTFYNTCYSRSEIKDITVEDPSENFQRVRDYVDARNCMDLASFQSDKLQLGFSDNMVQDAKNKLKLSKRQTRRIYEILRLKATNVNDKEQYRSYRLDVKKRLNAPFQKNGRDNKKLEQVLQPNELSATMNSWPLEQRHAYLEKAYEEFEEQYKLVIDRLEKYH
ncbi:histone acetyltransferase type B catalytic subunit-like [Mytilus californianus]|uniref:histone acetyltransferase type B catalytic subunit-like n=1 Tax=Mytilus californianus TaxID=6549 RepID=UPI0022473E74|nr:histone acetyltransferase type B catalytic subunit-like [Mytilus californianus]